MDVLAWLWTEVLVDPGPQAAGGGDRYFSSKGHDAPGLYALLIGLGKLDAAYLTGLRRLGGLPGHPDVSIPYMIVNTGSLGMGISKARGMAHRQPARRDPGSDLRADRRWRAPGGPVLGVAPTDRERRGSRRSPSSSTTTRCSRTRSSTASATSATSRPRCVPSAGRSTVATVTTRGRSRRRSRGFEGGGDRPRLLVADTIKGRACRSWSRAPSVVTACTNSTAVRRRSSTTRPASTELVDADRPTLAGVGLSALVLDEVPFPARSVPQSSPAADQRLFGGACQPGPVSTPRSWRWTAI